MIERAGSAIEAAMITHVTPSLVQPGYYYLKKGHRDWLRLVLSRHGDTCRYADITGYGPEIWTSTLNRWASLGFTEEEARQRFPEECAKIDKVIGAPITAPDAASGMMLNYEASGILGNFPNLELPVGGMTDNQRAEISAAVFARFPELQVVKLEPEGMGRAMANFEWNFQKIVRAMDLYKCTPAEAVAHLDRLQAW
ncbi:hypothetical protein [Bradyrhizobium sp. RDI18]|uniref:hypothetical protein n=1 Tax=Bradyrhizobium sp. RDI18 TaxID=3367400 RepID=UPI00371A07C7